MLSEVIGCIMPIIKQVAMTVGVIGKSSLSYTAKICSRLVDGTGWLRSSILFCLTGFALWDYRFFSRGGAERLGVTLTPTYASTF